MLLLTQQQCGNLTLIEHLGSLQHCCSDLQVMLLAHYHALLTYFGTNYVEVQTDVREPSGQRPDESSLRPQISPV